MNDSDENTVLNRARFLKLWERNLIAGAANHADRVYQQLINAYNEPQRVYHNLQHINHCLTTFDKVRHLPQSTDSIELAIWFHDVVYQPGSSDNEQLSAKLYCTAADGQHKPEMVKRVNRLIMATLHNAEDIEDPDCKLMVDIDLSSFALPWEEFLDDSKNLRRESGIVSDQDYYQKQYQFQQGLLTKEHFFLTDYFIEHGEKNAHRNLQKFFHIIEKHI
ncbi:MAG: putative metal-dependent HD superfamily phosphohydrolase [Planctomycetota bacterium]|jgi:predicted metal-dependent HD superfamily phosphohydrolase